MWQRSFNELSQIEEKARGRIYRAKRKTKTEFAETRLKKGEKEEMSPQYNNQLGFGIKKGEIYEVESADAITTRTGLEGLRVELRSKNLNDKRLYAETLWPSQNEVVSATSKFGSFINALGNDTDTWPHKWIRVDEWQSRLCVISLVPAPKPVGRLAKKAVEEMGAEKIPS